MAFAINHLTGRVRLWGTAEWDRGLQPVFSFSKELRKVFGLVGESSDAGRGLFHLRQGARTVSDFAIDFRTQAHRSNWNMPAMCDAFLHGLSDYIKD